MNWIVERDQSEHRVLRFLTEVDREFLPALSSRIDLTVYARKLAKNASNIFVKIDERDVAHAAFYSNDKINFRAYLSSVCVMSESRGTGLSRFLLDHVVSQCRDDAMQQILLEVNKDNSVAVSFYRKFGFSDHPDKPNFMILELVKI